MKIVATRPPPTALPHYNLAMPTGPDILLTLKVLVTAVTLVFAAAIAAIASGRKKLHGRLNTLFFALTATTVVGFEVLLRAGVDVSSTFSPETRQALRIHLGFALPAALLMPLMLWSGATGRRRLHLPLAVAFTLLWAGTVYTGLVTLPHR
jgi:hypothetical protein